MKGIDSASYYAQTASTPLLAHACNCIGCCPRGGTCRTWSGHTADYCALLVRQAGERAKWWQ